MFREGAKNGDDLSIRRRHGLVLLDPLERRVILYLRLLRSGRRGRAEIEQDIAARIAPGAEQALEHVERLDELLRSAIPRPLEIGSVEDARATDDERMVAELIGAAAGRRTADRRLVPDGAFALRRGRQQLWRAAEVAAAIFAAGTAPRCSCGRTSADHDRDGVYG